MKEIKCGLKKKMMKYLDLPRVSSIIGDKLHIIFQIELVDKLERDLWII